jgi:oligoribonuclease NrnB/cAMP/cGMP phosphodiesterase (DHH superfamily)
MSYAPHIIMYHNNCPDGFTAAYVAKLRYPFAQLVGLDHGLSEEYITSLISGCAETDVLMVDFSFRTREQNDMLAKSALSLRILDHHKTAQKVLEGAPYATFDLERSGAGLAWDFLFGKDSREACYDGDFEDRPWYVDYVEDRDLWRFKLPMSREVNAYIMTFPYDITGWDKMVNSGFMYAATAGEAVILQIEKYVREAVKQAQAGTLNIGDKHYTVGIVNIPYLNTSEVGHALAARYDIGLGWFERADGIIQFSARSIGDIDVSVIAQAFGGGGHKNAAGWQVPVGKGREIIDTILGRVHPEPEQAFGAY